MRIRLSTLSLTAMCVRQEPILLYLWVLVDHRDLYLVCLDRRATTYDIGASLPGTNWLPNRFETGNLGENTPIGRKKGLKQAEQLIDRVA